jgi:uncharacterized membrane protein YfcA
LIFENLPVVALIIFAAVFGGCIRRLSGFGGALIMTPLFMWIFPVPFLIPIVLSAEIFGGVLLSRHWQLHQEDRLRLGRMLLFAALVLPLGIYLGSLTPIAILKAFTSSLIIIFASYLLFKPHFQLAISKVFDGFAGGLSGFLLGSCGIGGPPVALYLNASHLPFDRARSLLSHFVTGISLLGIVAASAMGGGLSWLIYLSLAIPGYWLGMQLAGILLQRHVMTDASLKRLCLLLLIANSLFNLLFLLISKTL